MRGHAAACVVSDDRSLDDVVRVDVVDPFQTVSDLLSRGVPSPVHKESFGFIWLYMPRLRVVPRADENSDLALARELCKGPRQRIDTRRPVIDQASRPAAACEFPERYVVLQAKLQDLPAKAVISHGGKRCTSTRRDGCAFLSGERSSIGALRVVQAARIR